MRLLSNLLLILIAISIISSQANASNLYRRLEINLDCSNLTKANILKNLIDSNVTQSDKFEEGGKNIDLSIKTSRDSSKIKVQGTYLFLSESKASEIFSLIKSNLPTGTTGLISLHYCPIDNSLDDWFGCKEDPRADYQELLI